MLKGLIDLLGDITNNHLAIAHHMHTQGYNRGAELVLRERGRVSAQLVELDREPETMFIDPVRNFAMLQEVERTLDHLLHKTLVWARFADHIGDGQLLSVCADLYLLIHRAEADAGILRRRELDRIIMVCTLIHRVKKLRVAN